MKHLWQIITVTVAGAGEIVAQEPADTIKAKELEKVVITANRNATNEKKVPASIELLTSKQLQQFGPRTTPEALQLLNGVFVQKTNHGGGSPFVRGVTGNQVLTLVDGIRLNNAIYRYGPNQYLNTVDAFNIAMIEVAKGIGSVQYGSDAIGGTIQVFSNSIPFATESEKWTGRAIARGMSGGMDKTLRGELGYSGKTMAAMAGITYRDFGDIIGGDTTGKQSPSGYEEWAFNFQFRMKVSKATELTIAHQQVTQNHVPVYHKVVLENYAINEMDPQQRRLSYARTNTRLNNKIFRSLQVTTSWQLNKETRNLQRNGSNQLLQEADKVNTLGLTAEIQTQFKQGWQANSGIEIYYDKVNSNRMRQEQGTQPVYARGLYPDDARYGNYSVYGLHRFEWNNWTVDAGLRFNQFSIKIKDSALGEVTMSPSALVGNLGISYNLIGPHHVFASFNTAYRAPNVDDLGTLGIVDFRYEIPSSDLDPEKSLNYELGYKLRASRVQASASFYYMQLKNIIGRVRVDSTTISGYPVYTKENIESADIYGTEINVNWNITGGLFFYAGISYTMGENQSRNEPLRRIPPLNGRTCLSYQFKGWFAAIEWMAADNQDRLAQGDKDDNRIPAGGTPGWNVINLYGGYHFRQWNIQAGLQNLLNEDYRTHGSGINGYGRSLWISLTFQF